MPKKALCKCWVGGGYNWGSGDMLNDGTGGWGERGMGKRPWGGGGGTCIPVPPLS